MKGLLPGIPVHSTTRGDSTVDWRILRASRESEVVLVLHGGVGRQAPVGRWRDTAYLRMVPLFATLLRGARGRLTVVATHHRGHGWLRRQAETWDGSDIAAGGVLPALADDVLSHTGASRLHLVGHSSGGWAALRLMTDPRVASVLALAPWVAKDERVPPLTPAPARVVIAHGDRDRITSPTDSRHFAAALRAGGYDARFVSVAGGDHAMLRPVRVWSRVVAEYGRSVAGSARHTTSTGLSHP